MSEGNIPIDYNFWKHSLATQSGFEKDELWQNVGNYNFVFYIHPFFNCHAWQESDI